MTEGMQWYIIHTYSGFEQRVRESLLNRIEAYGMKDLFGEVLIPTENIVEIKEGKRRVSSKKFFPGYVLVQMVMNDETMQLVKSTPKVTGFIGQEAMSPEEVDSIMSHMTKSSESPKPKVVFGVGEKVKINDGPFASFQGIVESINYDKGTLTVMVTIFGRSTPVELNFLQVEKI